MSSDQCVMDNWALLLAASAIETQAPILCLLLSGSLTLWFHARRSSGSGGRASLNIHFHLLNGVVTAVLSHFVSKNELGAVMTDIFSLHMPHFWVENHPFISSKSSNSVTWNEVYMWLECDKSVPENQWKIYAKKRNEEDEATLESVLSQWISSSMKPSSGGNWQNSSADIDSS
ncbi:unnamed protein product, partial [Darwinula stevensoni]